MGLADDSQVPRGACELAPAVIHIRHAHRCLHARCQKGHLTTHVGQSAEGLVVYLRPISRTRSRFETERRETINKVPVLGDIPAVGNLFKSRSNVSTKAELLIFVTPRILEEGSSIY